MTRRQSTENGTSVSGFNWQAEALRNYDKIGEVHFATQSIARMMSRVRYFPATLDGKEIKSGPPVEAFDRIQDPGGGRRRLQFDYGRLIVVTGEGALFLSIYQGEERARFLWKDELKIRDDGLAERLNSSNQPTGEVGVAYRMWTPHPRHSDEADSPLRAVVDICRELIVLTQSVMATATTRMTNGILAYAQEITPTPLIPGSDEDDSTPWFEDFKEHLQAQIENPASAAARVPYTWEAPMGQFPDIRNLISWIQTHDPQTDYLEKDLRTEAIRRLALAMEMPPESLLGMTDANHWTAQQVMLDEWRSFGVPKAQQFAADMAQVYLRPILRDQYAYSEWADVTIALDDSKVVISPDRTTVANDAIDRIAIDREGYRDLVGIDQSLAPDAEEEQLLIALRTRNPQLAGMDLGLRGPVAELPQTANPSAGPPQPTNGRVVSRQESQTAAVVGAAKLALRQCRARAGARLRSHQHACDECRERTRETAASLVASVLGESQVTEFGLNPHRLVAGGTSEFRDCLTEWGIASVEADALCVRIESWAARTLFDRDVDLPPGFQAQVEAI